MTAKHDNTVPETGKGKKCISCKINISNESGAVKFKCPACSNYEIVRCVTCRKNVIKYRCPACGFEGPN